ncbi:hypothetical protein EU555_15770 [Methylobacterium nonmethylotrophicum]|uniref:Uncharacterized protein n=1 Tax=Methylobacterium nonmethylotrophicum TaxID=1141884 RepID=A0A4Z0NR22_9HYPH|nr:hypothetical protein EU555_15770 [Methylobacterium nonmethylotrophicum]
MEAASVVPPTRDLILRCRRSEIARDRRSLGLEGGLQKSVRSLEPSFEAAASGAISDRQHLRMRFEGRRSLTADTLAVSCTVHAILLRTRTASPLPHGRGDPAFHSVLSGVGDAGR